jgi:hypothetical protein
MPIQVDRLILSQRPSIINVKNIDYFHHYTKYKINLRIYWLWIDEIKISIKNDNLIITYKHPVINKLVYEFIDQSIINSIPNTAFIEKQYLYDTENYHNLLGVRFNKLRRKIKQFINTYPIHHIQTQKLIHSESEHIIKLYQNFSSDKINNKLIQEELNALHKTLTYKNELDTYTIFFLYIEGNIEGFAIVDYYTTNTAYIPFIKTNLNKKSSMYYFFYQICLKLNKQKISQIHFEDDLNDRGMAQFKRTLGPSKIISNKCYLTN